MPDLNDDAARENSSKIDQKESAKRRVPEKEGALSRLFLLILNRSLFRVAEGMSYLSGFYFTDPGLSG